MKVVASADWRDALPFETPMIVSEFAPGEDARCTVCGAASELRPRTELWAVKHRHPNDHGGYVRFYCLEHRPAARPVPPTAVPTPATRAPRTAGANAPRTERRAPTPKPTHPADRVRAMCPDCFIEISATGTCGNCGWHA